MITTPSEAERRDGPRRRAERRQTGETFAGQERRAEQRRSGDDRRKPHA